MNDQKSFERFLTERFEEFGPGRPIADETRDDLYSRARERRQLPRWLALIEQRPMRTGSHLAVGSPTARLAAILVATALLVALVAGAGIAGARLLVGDAAIIVAQDGSGDYASITEAVDAAGDGDTVLVRPGIYVEAVVIDEDIILSGDGPVEEIVMEAPEGGPTAPTGIDRGFRPAAYALLLMESDATVSGLTFRGEQSRVHAQSGSPVLEELVLKDVDLPHSASYIDFGGILVTGGSTATVRDSHFEGGQGILVYDGSEPLITGNTLRGGASIGEGIGAGTVIRGNEITGASYAAVGFSSPAAALIEGNVISDSTYGIWIGGSVDPAPGPFIRANSISSVRTGIQVGSGAVPTIEGNTLTDNEVAGIELSWGAGTALITDNDFVDNANGIAIWRSDSRIEANTIQGGTSGVVIHDGTPTITGNTIEGAAESGVSVGRGTQPTLIDNRICDNGTNLVVAEGAEPIMQGNDICPGPTTPPDD